MNAGWVMTDLARLDAMQTVTRDVETANGWVRLELTRDQAAALAQQLSEA
jgi:hypothetical protein